MRSLNPPRWRTRDQRHDLVWLSGWLFADLLLGLVVIFLAGTRGSSPIELAALTPSRTPTATVPVPTWTPYPTYTPGPSPTPYPTYTPGPSPTPYPTYTPGPSPTAYPTYTPWPTPRPSVTIVQAQSIGLDQSPYAVTLRTDPALFLSSNANDKRAAESQFRAQIHACMDSAAGAKTGLVLATGYNPDTTNGHDLAQRAMAILREEMPAVFGNPVQKDYHALTEDPLLNGMVTLEIYFVSDPKVNLPRTLLGSQCTPPPRTWCQGTQNAQSLIVYNWDVSPALTFVLDNQSYTIKSAKGTAGGANRTVGCIMVPTGRHTWSAGRAAGTFTVEVNKNPEPIRLCYSPAQVCPAGNAPSTPATGVQ